VTQQPSFLRIASQWVIAALLAAVLAALFILIAAVQLSSEESATKAHRRAVATLTEIDRLLPGIEDELEKTDVPPGGPSGAGFPIPVQLTSDEAETLRGAELRERILDGAAKLVYEDGMDSWSGADRDGVQRIERISAAGAVDTGLGLATESRHRLFVAGAVLLGIIALVLAAGLMVAVRDWNLRLVALGSVIIAGGAAHAGRPSPRVSPSRRHRPTPTLRRGVAGCGRRCRLGAHPRLPHAERALSASSWRARGPGNVDAGPAGAARHSASGAPAE
jgi:membrane protein implicated in regulation of membrane protease activity